MVMRLCLIGISMLVLASCSSAANFGQGLADKSTRYFTSRHIGKDYKTLAAQRDWSLERNPVIGKHVGRETLDNRNVIHFHEIKQESEASGLTLFGAVTLGETAVRYDYYAYLVSPAGKVLDYAHKRSNAKISYLGYDAGIIGAEIAGDEKQATAVKQIDAFVTSSGQGLQSWR